MKPFHRAYIDEAETQRCIEEYVRQWIAGCEEMRQAHPAADASAARASITSMFRDIATEEIWRNNIYQVNVRRTEGGIVHLSIKRIDRQTIHDWRHLQEIKNEIVGSENEGIELYPAESRLVDSANQYHLWVHPDPTFRFPAGWNAGRHVTDTSLGGSVNRPLERKEGS